MDEFFGGVGFASPDFWPNSDVTPLVIKYGTFSCSCSTEATAQTPYITGKNYCAVNRGLFGNGEARLRDGFGEWIVSESKSKGLEVLASRNPRIAAIFFLFLKVCGRCYRLTYKGNHEQGLGRAFLQNC